MLVTRLATPAMWYGGTEMRAVASSSALANSIEVIT